MVPARYTAAGGVVIDGDRVLVLHRPHRREVRLPKGHIEDGESAEAAALRETAEESGHLELETLADLGEQVVRFTSTVSGREIERVERYFLMRITGPRRGPGELEFIPEWLPWDDALAALTFPPEQEWLRRARAAATRAT
ncbi:MAG TPA: NUDIX domain-containing protein [Actinomycetota bacterium]